MNMSHEALPLSLFRSAFLERGLQRVCAPHQQTCLGEGLKPASCAKHWAQGNWILMSIHSFNRGGN